MNHRNQKLTQEYRAVFDERRQIIIRHRRVRLHNDPYSTGNILLSVAVACFLSATTFFEFKMQNSKCKMNNKNNFELINAWGLSPH